MSLMPGGENPMLHYAEKICELEGGAVEVPIAQVMEILKVQAILEQRYPVLAARARAHALEGRYAEDSK